eukprot:1151445-Pelagomonas_calceolata.AAC.1
MDKNLFLSHGLKLTPELRPTRPPFDVTVQPTQTRTLASTRTNTGTVLLMHLTIRPIVDADTEARLQLLLLGHVLGDIQQVAQEHLVGLRGIAQTSQAIPHLHRFWRHFSSELGRSASAVITFNVPEEHVKGCTARNASGGTARNWPPMMQALSSELCDV